MHSEAAAVLKNLTNFAIFENTCVLESFFFYKAAYFQACNFIKKRLIHRYFLVKFAKFLRTSNLKSTCE